MNSPMLRRNPTSIPLRFGYSPIDIGSIAHPPQEQATHLSIVLYPALTIASSRTTTHVHVRLGRVP